MGSTSFACRDCGFDSGPGWFRQGVEACSRCEIVLSDRPRHQARRSAGTLKHLVWLAAVGLSGIAASTMLILQLRASVAPAAPSPGRTAPRAAPVERVTAFSPPPFAAQLAESEATATPGCCAGAAEDDGCGSCPSEVPSRSAFLSQMIAPKPLEPEIEPGPPCDDHASSRHEPEPEPGEDDLSSGAIDQPSPDQIVAGDPAATGTRTVRVRDELCRVHVARVHGGDESGIVLLPDGRLGWPEGYAYTSEPFVPVSMDELRSTLLEGPYQGYSAVTTQHYLVLYRGSAAFAESSGRLLESLYEGLLKSCREFQLPVHEAEFPLVAVIYEDETAFRAASEVAEEVEAYYDVVTNQIHFFETSERDRQTPDLAALRKPQTVAHEGVHQILQNIGVQPRPSSWPAWLVEGLAEFFAPTTVRPGDVWDGANRINPFHMATIRELQDPFSATAFQTQGPGPGLAQGHAPIGRQAGASLIEQVVTRKVLGATDYALAWALTHFLVNSQPDAFRSYLKMLGAREPAASPTPAEHLEDFRAHFGGDLERLDRMIVRYLSRLREGQPLAHYAVFFEQPLSPSVLRRSAFVSQSPALIRQWVDENRSPQGGPVSWRALPFPTRSRAQLAAEGWLGQR